MLRNVCETAKHQETWLSSVALGAVRGADPDFMAVSWLCSALIYGSILVPLTEYYLLLTGLQDYCLHYRSLLWKKKSHNYVTQILPSREKKFLFDQELKPVRWDSEQVSGILDVLLSQWETGKYRCFLYMRAVLILLCQHCWYFKSWDGKPRLAWTLLQEKLMGWIFSWWENVSFK